MNSPLANSAMNYRTLKERLIVEMPELMFDDVTLLDTLEGITDVHEQIAAVLRTALYEEALAEGIDKYITELKDRKSDLESRAKRKRTVALNTMGDLGLKKITAPDMTISMKLVPPSVLILNDELVPDAYMRIKKEPNKTAIKEALIKGTIIPGCTLSNGNETIQIKV